MSTVSLPVLGALTLTVVLCWFTAVLLWRNTAESGERSTLTAANYAQTLVLVLNGEHALGQLLAVTLSSPTHQAFGVYLSIVACLWMSGTWLVFALLYTGREHRLTRGTYSLIGIPPVLLTLGVATDGLHHTVLQAPTVVHQAGRATLAFQWGPGSWAGLGYAGLVCSAAIWLLFRKFLVARNVYRKISFFHVVGGSILIGGGALSVSGLDWFPYLVLGPAAYSVLILVSAPSVVTYRYLQLVPLERVLSVLSSRWQQLAPMARDTIIQNMQSGVVVVDHNNRIVDINPLGRRMLAAEDERVVGQSLADVVPSSVFRRDEVSFLDPSMAEGEFQGIWVDTPDGQSRCFDFQITSLGPADDPVGRVAIINDVTDRERRKETLQQRTRELERQNEQLDQFAGVVSHDLRNPLSVAKGYLETADVDGEDGRYLDEAERSLDRMEAIVDDVLTLAREGSSIGTVERIALDDVAGTAWENVDTADATLDVVDQETFEGDPDRLLNLFENLFRNSIEHSAKSTQPAVDNAVDHDSTTAPSEHDDDFIRSANQRDPTPRDVVGPEVTPSETAAGSGATDREPPAGDTSTDSGSGVVVTVGWTDGGFYVADDGPGIPPDVRDEVFSFGYSTDDTGTGFGLAIVEQVAEAHGWTVDVVESASGGARFEVMGVDESGPPVGP